MPYKDPEKARKNALEYYYRNRERNREKQNAASLSWYHRNKERVLAQKKEWYYANHERALEESRARKQAAKERKRAAKAAELEERSVEMGLKINRCPLCKSAGAAKVKGSAYLAGCSRQKCRKWVGGDEAVTGTTMDAAIGGWNKWTEEELAEQEEVKRLEAEMAAEVGEGEAPVEVEDLDDEGAPDGEVPDEEGAGDDGDGGDEDGGNDAGDEDGGNDAGDAEAAGEEGEAYAQFELVLDGVRYIMVPDEEGCDGCAFCMAFGRRQVCAAESSEDFNAARVLCGEMQGQWREAEEE